MEVVIEIPEELYKDVVEHVKDHYIGSDDVWIAVANGTPLPKGHDRLVEAGAVIEALFGKQTIDDVPTIIDADKENRKCR